MQISLFIAGVASFKAFEGEGVKPDFVAGHSVGAFSAATAAGVIRFEDALKIVKLRGELMENAFEQDYGMGVVLGMEEKELQSIIDCHSNHNSPVYMSNRNAPDQFIISGSIAGIQKILELSKENGARCATLLKVSTPSHCPLLHDISSTLQDALHDIPLYRPNIPYTGNLTGRILYNTVDIRQDLAESVSSPVRWHDATSARRSLEELETATKKVPAMAYDIFSFQKLGALFSLAQGIDADTPGGTDRDIVLKEIERAVMDTWLSGLNDLSVRLSSTYSRNGGRNASILVRKEISEQWG